MIGVGPARGDFPRSIVETHGAFVWWYVDVVDASGNGAVLLWSFGLPFLPRSRDGAAPKERPALNLVVYEHGRATFYLLQQLDPSRCEWDGAGRWSLEQSRIERRDEAGRVCLQADLRLPIPGGGCALAELRFDGPICTGSDVRDRDHSWEPVSLGATATLRLDCGSGPQTIRGSGYHDRNGGEAALPSQGLASWRWARLALPTKDLVVYWLEPRDRASATKTLLFEADRSGRLEEHVVHDVTFAGWRLGPFGWWPRTIALDSTLGDLVLNQAPPVDEGPFYRRHLVRGRLDVEEGLGFSEHVRIRQLDRSLHRPFVNMRVHRTHGPNSFWLPLFSGPRSGRLARLFGSRGAP